MALLHYSPCISTYFQLHFPYLTTFCTLHFPSFHCTSSRNIGTLRLCLRHSLHTHTYITKSLFCVPTLVFIDHISCLHTTQMYHCTCGSTAWHPQVMSSCLRFQSRWCENRGIPSASLLCRRFCRNSRRALGTFTMGNMGLMRCWLQGCLMTRCKPAHVQNELPASTAHSPVHTPFFCFPAVLDFCTNLLLCIYCSLTNTLSC